MTFGFILLTAGLAALVAGIKGVTIADVLKGAIGPDNPIFTRGQVAGAEAADTPTGGGGSGDIDYSGALSIVQSAAAIAAPFGTTVVSGSRPGSTTTTGNQSDHSERNANRAANDIGVEGVDALKGPPPKQLDQAIVAIGDAFGRPYKGGKGIVDTFHRHGFQIQVIWRVPSYGGHMGHIHVGAHRTGRTGKKAPGARRR